MIPLSERVLRHGDNLSQRNVELEVIPPGFSVILTGAGLVANLYLAMPHSEGDIYAGVRRGFTESDSRLLLSLYSEWLDVHQTVCRAVGRENLMVTKVNVKLGKIQAGGVQEFPINLPPELEMGAIPVPFFEPSEYAFNPWMRNYLTKIGSHLFINGDLWRVGFRTDSRFQSSALGDHGKVLTRKMSVLVTPEVSQGAAYDIRKLQEEGFKVSVLPFVDRNRQKYPFVINHIDCHGALVEAQNGDLVLYILSSYYKQDLSVGRRMEKAAKAVGAFTEVIDDKKLPPLALNLWQFEDGRITMVNTGGGQTLEKLLEKYIGRSKLFVTERPVRELVKARGSLGCMVNYFPRFLSLS